MRAREIWKQHFNVVDAAARKDAVDPERFWEAALFFEKLTGITTPGEHSTLIPYIPTEETGKALTSLSHWYAENQYRLYWDAERKEVALLPSRLKPSR
jgi:hypothetical protein